MQRFDHYFALVVVMFLLCFPKDGLAEDPPTETTAPQKCSQGFQALDPELSALLFQVDLSKEEISSFVTELEACTKAAQAYSPDQRKKFTELASSLISRVDALILTYATAAFQQPEAAARDNKRIEDLQGLKKDLALAHLKLSENLPLDRGWGKDFVANFYVGYEGTSVSGVKEKGTLRTGMMVYSQLTGTPERDEFGIHAFGNVLLTSSAEQTMEEGADTDTVDETIEVDLNLYIPWGARHQTNGLLTIGPLGSLASRKVNQLDNYREKYMAGLRFAHSPESFFDILYGKTENVNGKRIELRGQLPVAEIVNGNIFVGGILNLAIDDKGESNDSIRMYVTWQVNFSDIIGKN